MEITPAHRHIHWEVLLSAGMPPIMTVGDPGIQGETVAGTHGTGVRTPSAAEVAAATAGLAMLVHMPNGAMLTNGLWSMMFAAGSDDAIARLVGSTDSTLGATPNEHLSIAPVTTWKPIACEPHWVTGAV